MSQKLTPYIDDKGVNHKPIYIDPVTEILYYLKKHQGQTIKFSLKRHKSQLHAAKRIANEELVSRLGKKKVKRGLPYCRDELAVFLAQKETAGLDETTLVRVRSTLRIKIEPFWNEKLVSDINEENVAEWIYWYKTKFPGETMDNAVKYLRNFCAFLSRRQLAGQPLLIVVPTIRDPDQKKIRAIRSKKTERVFTEEEFKRILSVANPTQYLVGQIMYTMATRIEETLTMRFNEEIFIDCETPYYRWRIGQNKADHEGQHFLPEPLVPILRDLYLRRKAEGTNLLFPQLRDNKTPISPQAVNIEGWRDLANIGWNWTSKTCRHTCLTNLFNNEDIPQIQILKLYRVSIDTATKTYAKVTDIGRMRMRNAIRVIL